MPYQPFSSTPEVRRRMQRMSRGRDTRAEVRLRKALWRAGLRGYRVNRRLPLPGVRRRADVAWVGRRVAVFVDGCFWHACPEHGNSPRTNSDYWAPKLRRNVERDRETDRLADAAGWSVVRVWEHEDPADAVQRIARIMR